MSQERWTAVDRYLDGLLVPPDCRRADGWSPSRPIPPTRTRNPDYLGWALSLTRPGSLIVADNVVRGGAVADAESSDPSVCGVRRFPELVAAEPRLCATAIQTVGVKGYDGLALALVVSGPSEVG